MSCGLGKKIIIVGECVVHTVEEVLYVIAYKTYAFLSTESEAAQQHCYQDF